MSVTPFVKPSDSATNSQGPPPPESHTRSPRPRAKHPAWLVALPLLILLAAWLRQRPEQVTVAHPQYRRVVESLAASGQVHGNIESQIGSELSGRVEKLLVREGAKVRSGQILAYLDTRVLKAQLQQAEEAVRVAEAQLVKASRPALASEIAKARSDASQAAQVASANLGKANQRLAELERGPTREAKLQALGNLQKAQAQAQQAEQDLQKQRRLFAGRQVPRSALDQAESAYQVAAKANDQSQEQLAQSRRDLDRERQLYSTNQRTNLDHAENAFQVAQETLGQRTADLMLAQQEVSRQEALFKGGASPRAELDRARAAANSAGAGKELARANLEKARTDLQREQSLFKDGQFPRSALDKAESAFKVAGSAAAQARLQLEQAKRNRETQKQLYDTGNRTELDHAIAAYKEARGAVTTAQAALRDLQVGTRPEVLRQAEADVTAARGNLEGALKGGQAQIQTVLSQPRREDVDLANAQLAEARQALLLARERTREAIVTAPFSGMVTAILTEAGGVTGPSQPVLRLVRTGVPEIWLDVDENNLGRLRRGQRAVVTSNAFTGEQFQARLREIGAQVDVQRGTVQLKLRPIDPPAWLRPGQTLNVNIIVDEGSRRLTVPVTAVSSSDGRSYVNLVRDGRVYRQLVQTGPAGMDDTPILEGLKEGDQVILSPQALTAGQSVRVRAATAR